MQDALRRALFLVGCTALAPDRFPGGVALSNKERVTVSYWRWP